MFVLPDPALDRAHVGGRLLVDAAERHVRDRVGGGEDRRAARLGADAGVGGAAVELGGEAEVGRRRGDDLADRRRVVEDVAEVGLQLRGVELPWRPRARSPRRSVNSSSSPTGEPSTLQRRASSRITATAALLSAPRMPSLAFSQPPSTITGSIGTPPSSTVSRCAQSRIERSPRPGRRASRLPAASSSASSRIPRSSACTRSEHSRSCPNGLAMRQSAAKVSLSRARSASEAGLKSRGWKRPAVISPRRRRLPRRARRSRGRRRARTRRPRSRGTAARGARGGT